jgi:glycosyltransferase involved in cell wall biosynthesis
MKNSLRIAIYHNLTSGGAKRALYELSRLLVKEHLLDVYTLETSNHEFGDIRPYVHSYKIYSYEPLPVLHSPFGRLNPLIRLLNLKRVGNINKKIALDIESSNYNVVFVNPCQFETAPSLLRYLWKTPSVYFCQEPPRIVYEDMPQRPYDNKDTLWRSLLRRIDLLPSIYLNELKRNDQDNTLNATKVLVNSLFMRESIRGIYGNEPEVCYLGTDVEFFHPNETPKEDFLLSVGSLTTLKGFDFLLEAVASLPEHNRPKLLIASNFQNQPERDHLNKLADQLRVDLVYHSQISDDSLVSLYNQARITIYASIREPFGLVPLESMASGTPVVSVRDGGMQETILDGKTGFLVDRNPIAFAEAIQRLINDPALARRMGENGRQHVLENWTWEKAAERLEGYLYNAANMIVSDTQRDF